MGIIRRLNSPANLRESWGNSCSSWDLSWVKNIGNFLTPTLGSTLAPYRACPLQTWTLLMSESQLSNSCYWLATPVILFGKVTPRILPFLIHTRNGRYNSQHRPRLGDVQHETAPVIARLLDEAYWVYFNWSHWSLLSSQHPWGGCLGKLSL